ncbi:early nodulin-75-like [Acanthaster planci]|uniref:Early nodulin-75-like n=1 Tax=Acanthaster planci TaxID=133434 RepID=A0A8B8A0U0_ACAPL|nr:early nodulin-75-like [Acanthaster planci]
MEQAYALASRHSSKTALRNRKLYNKKLHGVSLQPGDRVLVRNLNETGGPGKLRAYWEEKIHIVIRQMQDDMPVYEVKPENGLGRTRVLHRNLLLSCDHLPASETHGEQPTAQPKKQRRSKRLTHQSPSPTQDGSSSDEEVYLQMPHQLQEQFTPEEDIIPDRHQTLGHENPTTSIQPSSAEPQQELEMQALPDLELNVEPEQQPGVAALPEPPVDEAPPEGSDVSTAETEARYPSRNRQPPDALTYDQLGVPRQHVSAVLPVLASEPPAKTPEQVFGEYALPPHHVPAPIPPEVPNQQMGSAQAPYPYRMPYGNGSFPQPYPSMYAVPPMGYYPALPQYPLQQYVQGSHPVTSLPYFNPPGVC